MFVMKEINLILEQEYEFIKKCIFLRIYLLHIMFMNN